MQSSSYCDSCSSSPCENGGSCMNIGCSYYCMCLGVFYGQNCQWNNGNEKNLRGILFLKQQCLCRFNPFTTMRKLVEVLKNE